MYNHIQYLLNLPLGDCKIIPLNACATRYYNITLEGWKEIVISDENSAWNEILRFCIHSIEGIVEMYKDTHAFSEPQFIFKPDGHQFKIKIGTMENELYEKLSIHKDK